MASSFHPACDTHAPRFPVRFPHTPVAKVFLSLKIREEETPHHLICSESTYISNHLDGVHASHVPVDALPLRNPRPFHPGIHEDKSFEGGREYEVGLLSIPAEIDEFDAVWAAILDEILPRS